MRGLGCGGFPGAEAHERRGARALPRARNGGGDVAAMETVGAAWQGEEGSRAGGSGARGLRGCCVWWLSSRRWLPGLPEQRRRRSAPVAEEAEKERGGRRRLDWFANSEKFKGPTVKLE